LVFLFFWFLFCFEGGARKSDSCLVTQACLNTPHASASQVLDYRHATTHTAHFLILLSMLFWSLTKFHWLSIYKYLSIPPTISSGHVITSHLHFQ
jgi:hypothetical protein